VAAEVWLALPWPAIGIYLVAGAAAAFNCIVEKGIDAKMKPHRGGPLPVGELSDSQTLVFSAVLGCHGFGDSVRVGQPAHDVAHLCHLCWLRGGLHRDPQATDAAKHRDRRRLRRHAAGVGLGRHDRRCRGREALILFLIIFLWTPPHFWALALYRVEDYRKSGLPMLPVTHGSEFTRLQILLYTLACCSRRACSRSCNGMSPLAVPGRWQWP